MRIADENLLVDVETEAGAPTLYIEDAATGRTWGPVPVVKLDVFNAMVERVEPGGPPSVRAVTPIERGVHLQLVDRGAQITLSILLSVRDGRLVVRMPMSEWVEEDAGVYRLYNVHILPGLLQVGASGKVLLPLDSGIQFTPAGKPAVNDSFLIYGEQNRWELLPMLPVAAVGDKDAGMAVLATGCPEDASIRVWTDGRGAGGLDAGACLRQNWIDPVDKEDRELVFVPVTCDPDLLHATADVLRRHVVEDMGKKTLDERAEESPEVRYLFCAPSMKLAFAVRNDGCGRAHQLDPDHGSYLLSMTYRECIEDLRRLKAAGVNGLHTISVGFTPNGHDGGYPSHDRFDERLGGKCGFQEMLAVGHELGYHMNVHDNYNEGYEISPDFDWRWCSRDLYGQPQKRGRWGGGQGYLQWMLALPDDRVEGALARMKALGLSGIGYIDAIGNPLYRNYSEAHGGPRRHHALGIQRVLKAAGNVYGGVTIECGFLYAARYCDSVCMPGSHHGMRHLLPEWPIARLIDEQVPLYRLALSGLIMSEGSGDADRGHIMRILSLGLHPRFEVSHGPAFGTPVLDDAFVGRIKNLYDLCCGTFSGLQRQRLVRWEMDKDGVERTAFADGTDVSADFEKNALSVNGKDVVSEG